MRNEKETQFQVLRSLHLRKQYDVLLRSIYKAVGMKKCVGFEGTESPLAFGYKDYGVNE